jgi:peptidoglycan/xylan/chitin deacetylase (PgdA/CDA1 family)
MTKISKYLSMMLIVMGCLQLQATVAQPTITDDSLYQVSRLVESSVASLTPIVASPTLTQVILQVTPQPTVTPNSTLTLSITTLVTTTKILVFTPIPTSTPSPTVVQTPLSMIEPTPVDPAYTVQVPILMYHYLSEPSPYADRIRLDLSITPALFETHLAYLREAGYETISMQQFYHAMTMQLDLPAKPVILTFDDGYRDAYENAFPLLKKYNYQATFFVFTQPIDTYNVDFLTWEMIIEMHQAGMEFGSHSYTHPDMRNRDDDFLVYQILGSKEAIEARIGEPVRFFCYPSGRYDQQVIRVLESAGFWGAVTTQWGSVYSFNNRFEMHRIRVSGGDTADTLAAVLRP